MKKKLIMKKITLANLTQANMHGLYGGVEETEEGRTCISKCASLCCGGPISKAGCDPNTYMDQTCPATYFPMCKPPFKK